LKPTQRQALPILLAAALAVGTVLPLAMAQNPPAAAKPAAAAPAPAEAKKVAPETVVVQIGDEKITAGEFNTFLAAVQPDPTAAEDPSFRRQLAEGLVRVRVLAREARKRGLDKADKTRSLLSLAQDQVLAQAVADQLVTDDVVRATFNDKGYITARHILISTKAHGPDGKTLTEDEAKKTADAVRARLAKGEDFAAVAKVESDDPGSKDTGGVYTFPKGQMVPEFETAAFGLKEGELSQPVKTKFGYHLIQRMAPDVKQVRPQIVNEVAPKRMDDLLADLKKQTPVTLNPDFFGAPPLPTAGGTAVPGAPGSGDATPAPTGGKK
jgi:peptidyl-prolyl cis-trans isomerase C